MNTIETNTSNQTNGTKFSIITRRRGKATATTDTDTSGPTQTIRLRRSVDAWTPTRTRTTRSRIPRGRLRTCSRTLNNDRQRIDKGSTQTRAPRTHSVYATYLANRPAVTRSATSSAASVPIRGHVAFTAAAVKWTTKPVWSVASNAPRPGDSMRVTSFASWTGASNETVRLDSTCSVAFFYRDVVRRFTTGRGKRRTARGLIIIFYFLAIFSWFFFS